MGGGLSGSLCFYRIENFVSYTIKPSGECALARVENIASQSCPAWKEEA